MRLAKKVASEVRRSATRAANSLDKAYIRNDKVIAQHRKDAHDIYDPLESRLETIQQTLRQNLSAWQGLIASGKVNSNETLTTNLQGLQDCYTALVAIKDGLHTQLEQILQSDKSEGSVENIRSHCQSVLSSMQAQSAIFEQQFATLNQGLRVSNQDRANVNTNAESNETAELSSPTTDRPKTPSP